MPFALTLSLDGVYLRAGRVRQSFPVAGQVKPTVPWNRLTQFGTLVYHPRALGWLRVDVSSQPDPAVPAVPFAADPAGLDAVCQAHAVPRDQVAPPKFLEVNRVLVASLPTANRVVLTADVDTDHPEFAAFARSNRDAATGSVVVPVDILFFDGKQFGTYAGQAGRFSLALRPCAPLPEFAGAVAVDLGNTVTTAALARDDDPVHAGGAARLVALDDPRQPDRTLLPTAVRVDRVRTPADAPAGPRRFPGLPGDDAPTAVEFLAGGLASAGAADDLPEGLVFGAKQLLTVRPGGSLPDRFAVNVETVRHGSHGQVERVEVDNGVPGELVFTHAVRRFRETEKAWPSDLVLTYPTTYTHLELDRLARAATRGWLRAMGEPQSGGAASGSDEAVRGLATQAREWLASPPGPGCDVTAGGVVGLALDEASAAAFFHIQKRVFGQPGGLRRFRYLYPDGSHLLVVDCGGGTTDVVLARVKAQAGDGLDVTVLGRTGARGFGGDHVTRGVARLIKTRLAVAILRATDPGKLPAGPAAAWPGPPSNPALAQKAVTDYLTKIETLPAADAAVPTRHAAGDGDPQSLQRRAAWNALWRLADAVKARLKAAGEAKPPRPVKLGDLPPEYTERGLSALVAAVLRAAPPAAADAVKQAVKDVAVWGWEADALARPAVKDLVEKCNRLIAARLGDAEVDWVVLSGNGARYPLFEKVLADDLHVAYLADRLTVDPANMKHAVARGAVLARMYQRSPQRAAVHFAPRNLSRLLPFDIGWHDNAANLSRRLFDEFTPYDDLAAAPRTVEIAADRDGRAGSFMLVRRFPGDGKYAPFARYAFQQPLSGRLTVAYDPGTDQFEVTDAATGEPGRFIDLSDPLEHQSPVTRADF